MASFGRQERRRQHEFRDSSTSISYEGRAPDDDKGRRNGHLLALGYEDENLYLPLRKQNVAKDFFSARGIKWWQSPRSGDNTKIIGPTRNLASSQIACVNFLLPLVDTPEALVSILNHIDDDVVEVAPLEYRPLAGKNTVSSPVEFEWVGLNSCLEGGAGTRGANTTSVDALMVGGTATGTKRAYLFEWKYVEEYKGAESLGEGKSGETRRSRYSERYSAQDSRFNGRVPLDELLYEPCYQIMRLCLLSDKMVQDEEFGISEAKVVVVCPEDNDAYRETITSPTLKTRLPNATRVEDVVKATLRDPSDFAIMSPEDLVDAVRESLAKEPLSAWLMPSEISPAFMAHGGEFPTAQNTPFVRCVDTT
jgi:hypothetical protein